MMDFLMYPGLSHGAASNFNPPTSGVLIRVGVDMSDDMTLLPPPTFGGGSASTLGGRNSAYDGIAGREGRVTLSEMRG